MVNKLRELLILKLEKESKTNSKFNLERIITDFHKEFLRTEKVRNSLNFNA